MPLLLLMLFCLVTPSLAVDMTYYNIDDILDLSKKENPERQKILAEYNQQRALNRVVRSEALPRADLSMTFTRHSDSMVGSQFRQVDPNSGASSGPDRVSFNRINWKIQTHGTLYSFGKGGALIDMYDAAESMADLSLNIATDQYNFVVLEKFSRALIAQNFQQAALKRLDHAQSLFNFAQVEHQGGSMSQIDYLRTRANLRQAKAQLSQADNDVHVSSNELRLVLGMPPGSLMALKPNRDLSEKFFQVQDSQKEAAYKPLQLAKLQLDYAAHERSYRQAKFMPTIGLVAGVEALASPDSIYAPDDTASDAFDTERFNYFVGLTFDWNLFEGLGTSARLDEADSKYAVAKVNLNNLQRESSWRVSAAESQLKAAKDLYQASVEMAQAANLFYQKTRTDFKKGAATLGTLLEAEEDYLDAVNKQNEAYGNLIHKTASLRLAKGQYIF